MLAAHVIMVDECTGGRGLNCRVVSRYISHLNLRILVHMPAPVPSPPGAISNLTQSRAVTLKDSITNGSPGLTVAYL